MPISILMPALSPTMEEGKLAKWLKSEGDTIESGDIIAEIETDKATMEVEAVDEGVLGKILINEGQEGVKVNQMIAVLIEEDEDQSSIEDFLSSQTNKDKAGSQTPSEDEVTPSDKTNKQDNLQGSKVKESENKETRKHRIFISPLARRLADQSNIDITNVKGSGPRGRIVKADILSFSDNNVPMTNASPTTTIKTESSSDTIIMAQKLGQDFTTSENSSVRKVIAKRLTEAKQTIPHFYLTIECNIDNLLQSRKEINAQSDGSYKISVNDFIVKACANALKAYPSANVSWADDVMIHYDRSDISVAVATDQGLITPIIKSAEQKGLIEISNEIKELAGRAREGKLKPEEFQGGSFTVSNLGMYGIKEFSAIINPPQSCILAIGAGEQRPYVVNNEIKIGNFMTCTLSTDHRSVDGAVGAEFLSYFKKYIENPVSMLL